LTSVSDKPQNLPLSKRMPAPRSTT